MRKEIILAVTIPILLAWIGHEVFAETTWHPGTNLQQGDYFRYDFCHADYHECRNLDLQLLVVDETSENWYFKLIINDNTARIEGFLELSKDQIRFSGYDQTTERFADLFNTSLVWLANFSNIDEPKNLSEGENWGRIGNIGGMNLEVMHEETVKIDSKIMESNILGWMTSGTPNQIWITDDLPFPIRSNTFIHVGAYPLPVFTDYVLVEHGTDFREIPPLIFPPLEQERHGVLYDDIVCTNDLLLVLKNVDSSPACVTVESKTKLIERRWTSS